MRVGGQRHAPAVLSSGKTQYLLYRRLDGPQSRSELVRKFSPTTGIRCPDRPARRESLYRLSYPGSLYCLLTFLYLRDVRFMNFVRVLLSTRNVYVFLSLSMYSYCSSMYSYRCLCIFIVVYVFLEAATLNEVFPCFFLGCKANARV
jgi:hypothetical protein